MTRKGIADGYRLVLNASQARLLNLLINVETFSGATQQELKTIVETEQPMLLHVSNSLAA